MNKKQGAERFLTLNLSCGVEIYQRMADGSWRYDALEGQGTTELSCIHTSLSLDDIYENVLFKKDD